MLHKVRSLTSAKIVCCHNATPHTLRDELTCGSFQLSVWRLTVTRIVFDSALQEKLALTLIEDIIFRSEREKQDKIQISAKFCYNVSDSELKILQRVRF